MVLSTDSIFPYPGAAENEFFISEGEQALRPRLVIKINPQTVSEELTFQDDDELFMSLSTNSTYEFELVFEANGDSNALGLKYTFSGPTSSIGRFYETVDETSISTTLEPLTFGSSAGGSIDGSFETWAAKGFIQTGNTAGKLQFKWSQAAGSTDTTINGGAWLKVTKQ